MQVRRLEAGGPVRALRVSRDGRWLAALLASGGGMRLYTLAGCEWTQVRAWMGEDWASVNDMAFHPTEEALVTAGSGQLLGVWSLKTGEQQRALGHPAASPEQESGYSRAVFSLCGRYLDVHSMGRRNGERYLWESGELLATRYGAWGPIVPHPEGRLWLVCSVQIETFTQSKLCTWEGNGFRWYAPWLLSYLAVGGACFSADGRTLAMVGGTGTLGVQVHRFPSCEVLLTQDLDTLPEDADLDFPLGLCEAVALSADGSLLFTPTVSGEIVERSLPDGAIRQAWATHEGRITTFQVHPTEPWLVSGAEDGVIAFSEVPTLRLPQPLAGETVTREFQERFAALPNGEWTDAALDVEFEGSIPGLPDA